MGNLLGWGRYRTQAYPSTGQGGAAGAAGVPLQRQRFIDGDTPQAGLNGSVAEPFKTIAQFMASRGDASVADATANYVGWVMPALAGYVENVAFPHFSSTELRADSLSLAAGTVITGNVTWPNTLGAGGDAATPFAVVTMHNLSVTGSFTVTDSVEAPNSVVFFGADEAGRNSVSLGSFVSSTTQKLIQVFFSYTDIDGDITAGTGAANAAVVVVGCTVEGDVTANSFGSFDSVIGSDTIDVGVGGAIIKDTSFSSSTVLTSTAPATFDGDSWRSFVGAGGTRGAGTVVLVEGGYNGADVPGAALTGASTSVALNGSGATAGFTGENSGNHYTTSNGTPTTVTLLTAGANPGDTMLITKTDLGANALAVVNGGGGAGTLGTIPTISRGFVLARFDGTNWVFVEGGSMLA